MSDEVTPDAVVETAPEHEDGRWEDDGGAVGGHDSMFRHKMQALAKIVDEKLQQKEIAQAGLNKAKAELDAAYEDLHKAAKDNEQFLPFGHPTEEAPSQAVPDKTTAVHEQDESWRAIPLDQALDGLTKGIIDSLHKNDPRLEMMGDLADWCKDKRLIDIEGIGKGKAEKIEEALMRFWERRAKASQAQPTPEADPVQADLEAMKAQPVPPAELPWKAEGEPAAEPEPVAGGEVVDAEFTLSNDTPARDTSPYAAGY